MTGTIEDHSFDGFRIERAERAREKEKRGGLKRDGGEGWRRHWLQKQAEKGKGELLLLGCSVLFCDGVVECGGNDLMKFTNLSSATFFFFTRPFQPPKVVTPNYTRSVSGGSVRIGSKKKWFRRFGSSITRIKNSQISYFKWWLLKLWFNSYNCTPSVN